MDANIYEMTVDLSIIEHLGINLHSNIDVVLAEVMANAWNVNVSGCRSRGLHIDHTGERHGAE